MAEASLTPVAGSGAQAAKELRTPDAVAEGNAEDIFAEALLSRWMTAQSVILEADSDCDGLIDLAEFKDLCMRILHLSLSEEQVQEIFYLVDKDKSGSCSTVEIQKAAEEAVERSIAKKLSSKPPLAAYEPMDTKLVALVAHNNMKPSMMAFVSEHVDFFKCVRITTTGSTGTALEKKLGLKVAHKVVSGPLGGDQEIGGLISRDQVAAVFFFIDALTAHPHEADIIALTRLCIVHDVATANNPRTGSAMVHAFKTSPMHVNLLLNTHDSGQSDIVSRYIEGQKKVIATVAKKEDGAAS